jgi:hypothetical protein
MIAVCVTKATECVAFVTQTAIFPGGIANQDSRAGLLVADLIVVRLQTAATRCAEVQSPLITGRATPKWLVIRQRVRRCGAGTPKLRRGET